MSVNKVTQTKSVNIIQFLTRVLFILAVSICSFKATRKAIFLASNENLAYVLLHQLSYGMSIYPDIRTDQDDMQTVFI